jgi:hypothetical protein
MTPVESVVEAVLYEGYMLYPYRSSSMKNRQRWTFGGVYPRAYSQASGSDPWLMQSEFLIRGDAHTWIGLRPGFLQVIERIVLDAPSSSHGSPASEAKAWRQVAVLDIDERRYYPRQEATERHIQIPELVLGELLGAARDVPFSFDAGSELQTLADCTRTVRGALRRTRCQLKGHVEVAAQAVADGVYQLSVRILNETPIRHPETLKRDAASLYALVSCHTVLTVKGGECVSSIDPPAGLEAAAALCKNIGAWPVLVGDEAHPDTMLASPVILYDYPQIAAGAAGPAGAFPVSALDQRFEPVSAWAELDARPYMACVRVAGVDIQVGDQVRLHPRCRADIFDIALSGMVATIESIERDFDDHVHVAVTIDDDPGKDFDMARPPGHRFFFGPDEIEPLNNGGRRA